MTIPLKRIIYKRLHCVFYSYCEKQGEGATDNHISVYSSWTEIPCLYRKIVMKSPWLNVMFYRLRSGDAKLLCYVGEDQKIKAYGWIQDWRFFKRRFRDLATEGTMLGPYWTKAEERGKGYYQLVLQHSLSLCPKDKPILIYTSPGNIASKRGIEKAGFAYTGEWLIRDWCMMFGKAEKISI